MKKRTNLIIMSIVLVGILTVGATFAYLTAMSGEKTNTFTVGNNISIVLAEPAWDNLDFVGTAGSIDLEHQGQTLAQNILPGRTIPKDPKVKNTSTDPVWVAIKLDYTGTANTFAAIDAFADIDFNNSDKWEAKDGLNTVFYYNVALASDAVTDDLFTKVLIDTGVSHTALKDFTIDIQAYAVQAEGLTLAEAKTQLNGLMD